MGKSPEQFQIKRRTDIYLFSKTINRLLCATRNNPSATLSRLQEAERNEAISAHIKRAKRLLRHGLIFSHNAVIPQVIRSVLVFVGVFILSSCGVISNLDSMRASMDQMAYYTGLMATNMPVMAHSTSRIADTAVRMDKKTDEIFQSLEKRATAIDRNIVGTSQDTLAQNKQMIKELTGIKTELAKITVSLQQPKEKNASVEPDARKMTDMQQKLKDLEKQINELSAKVKQLDKTP